MTARAGWPPEDKSDAELLQASVEDPELFGIFYDRHVSALLSFFYRRTASAQLAADLTAETFAEEFLCRGRSQDAALVPASARHMPTAIPPPARHPLSRS